MPENAGAVAAPDNSPSLVSVVGEMYGDFRDAEPETQAGAPPAETPETPARSEGTAASEPTGDTPVVAEPQPEPDSSSPDLPADVDYLEGSKPLGYTVNGESRAFDGITVLKDGGAIIEPDALAKVQRVFGERDHLFEQNRTQFEKYSTLERLSEWPVKDAQGNTTTISGAAALQEHRAVTARLGATLTTLNRAFTDPELFASLVDVRLSDPANPDSPVVVALNTQALRYLQTEAENASIKAERTVREYFTKASVPPPPPETPVTERAMPTIEALIAEHKITGLTAADKQFLAGHFESYVVRTKDGPAIKQQFVELLKNHAAMRAETTSTASAASTAAANNAARLAAAARGGKSAVRQPARLAPTKEAERSRDDDFDDLWDKQQRAASGALRSHAGGR